ncbi:MAG: nucleotidyltransferase family protein [Chloroflexota bacterium]
MTLLDLLDQRRAEILALAENHGAYNVRIFGSVARSEARPDSDIDFLVEFKPGYGLIDRIALMQELGDLLGRDVDVVRERSLRQQIRERVLKDAVPL